LTVLGNSDFTGTVTGTGILDVRGQSFRVSSDVSSKEAGSVFNVGSTTADPAGAASPVVTVAGGATLDFPTVSLQPKSTLVVENQGKVLTGTITVTDQSTLEIHALAAVQTQTVMVSGNESRLMLDGSLSTQSVTINTPGSSYTSATPPACGSRPARRR
jgi:hypothetical protein